MNPDHLKIESGYPNKAGGQQVGVFIGVKVTHEPTGLFVFCDQMRSQQKNLRVCQAMLERGLAEIGWSEY